MLKGICSDLAFIGELLYAGYVEIIDDAGLRVMNATSWGTPQTLVCLRCKLNILPENKVRWNPIPGINMSGWRFLTEPY